MASSMKVKKVITKEVEVSGLGRRIKDARMSLPRSGKSLEALCGEVGISRTYWYDIEKERIKGSLSFDLLRSIESALGIDLGVKIE